MSDTPTSRHARHTAETAAIVHGKQILSKAVEGATVVLRDLAAVGPGNHEKIEEIRLCLRRMDRDLRELGQPKPAAS